MNMQGRLLVVSQVRLRARLVTLHISNLRTCTTFPVALYSLRLNLRVPECVPVTLVVNLQHRSDLYVSALLSTHACQWRHGQV
jgi:hypothetical protein